MSPPTPVHGTNTHQTRKGERKQSKKEKGKKIIIIKTCNGEGGLVSESGSICFCATKKLNISESIKFWAMWSFSNLLLVIFYVDHLLVYFDYQELGQLRAFGFHRIWLLVLIRGNMKYKRRYNAYFTTNYMGRIISHHMIWEGKLANTIIWMAFFLVYTCKISNFQIYLVHIYLQLLGHSGFGYRAYLNSF